METQFITLASVFTITNMTRALDSSTGWHDWYPFFWGGGAMSLINWEGALRDETKTAARDTRVSFTGEGTH